MIQRYWCNDGMFAGEKRVRVLIEMEFILTFRKERELHSLKRRLTIHKG